MTDRKRKSNDNNSIALNKDVLSIIGSYVRPKLWLYWIYNSNVYHDEIEYSNVIEADSYKNACIEIFNKHADHLLKHNMINLRQNNIEFMKEIEDLVTSDGHCNTPDCKRKVSATKFCPDHFPSNETILKYVGDDKGKYNAVNMLEGCHWRASPNKCALKIKELKW